MGEIKGQLLGIIMVLTIFALVGGVMVSVFKTSSEAISSRVAAENDLLASMGQ